MRNFKNIGRTALFSLCFFSFTAFLYAQEEEIAWNNDDDKDVKITREEDVVWVFEPAEQEEVIIEYAEKKGPFRVPPRTFEIGFLNFGLGFSNDFMTVSQFFKKKIVINLDKFSEGFNITGNLALNPVFFNFNRNNIWGFGVSTGLYIVGAVDLNGSMLTFHEAGSAESDIGAAVFSEVNVHGFFTYEKFKIKIKPAVYYPFLYASPDDFFYTFKNRKKDGVDKTYFNIGLDMRIYTAFPLEDDFDILGIPGSLSAKPGVDISIGAEYPLSEVLGLTDKFDFLFFDVGVEFVNIPLRPAAMEDYTRMIVNIGSDEPIDFFNGMFEENDAENSEEDDMSNFYNYKYEEHGKGRRDIFRPFKMIISANWYPFEKHSLADSDLSPKEKRDWLTFTPTLGFAINPLYFQPFSVECGMKARYSFINFFIVSLDTGYHDRLFKNSLDFQLNFKVFEVDFGVNMQSAGFLKSWSGGGFGAAFGLKFGW